VKRCLKTLVCVVTALHLVGGHWGVLQMVAWTKMLAEYTEERGLIEGVKDTFDGNHACPMCKRIAVDKEREQQESLPVTKFNQDNLVKWLRLSPESVVPQPRWCAEGGPLCHAAPISPLSHGDAQPLVPPPEVVA
jgi:hypothetical protein